MTKKKLLILSAFLMVFGLLVTVDAFAVDITYQFSGYVYKNGVAAANVYVNLWAEFTEEVDDGEVPGHERKHFQTVTNQNGYYRFRFTKNIYWTPGRYSMWFSMDPIVYSTSPQICKGYYYYLTSGGSFARQNSKNISLQYCYGCYPIENPIDEIPDCFPSSWDHVFTKFMADAGSAMNWENRLFGRLQPY